ncbi:MAG: crossover junction endodeoxyribonuclease RuvC [Anaerolineaceae bacterium]|nr:crossover junction endodeoxyribonuclease RuvC [Anaerolineaceae bacterium]
MIVVGIDPGTAITGYAFIKELKDGSLEVLDYGVITTPAKQALEIRLLKIHQELNKLVALHQPQSGAVESLFFQKNVKTALSVGHARGVVLLAFAEAGLPVTDYTPLQVKQAVVGYGKADKHQVQHMVKALLGLEDIPRPDDAADALAVAICHMHSRRINEL